jgi:GTP cyclohydrolase I
VVESENFESIHNHSAYALIERDKDQDPDADAAALSNVEPL